MSSRPGVEQLPALSVVILLQALEPVRRLTQPGAVQQVLEGGGHVQVLVNREGHSVVQVVEKVVRPLVDRADWVVHGDLKSQMTVQQLRRPRVSLPRVRVLRTSCLKAATLTDLVEGLAGVGGVPLAGLSDQSGQQGATGEMDQGGGAAREAVGRVGNRKPVQNSGSDVCHKREWENKKKK